MARVSGKVDQDRNLARVGEAIRALRKEHGLSQEALADAAGIDRSHMGKIERGERNISLLNLLKVSVALGAKPSDVLRAAQL